MAVVLEQPVHSPDICVFIKLQQQQQQQSFTNVIYYDSHFNVANAIANNFERRNKSQPATQTFAPQANRIRSSSNGCIIMIASARAL